MTELQFNLIKTLEDGYFINAYGNVFVEVRKGEYIIVSKEVQLGGQLVPAFIMNHKKLTDQDILLVPDFKYRYHKGISRESVRVLMSKILKLYNLKVLLSRIKSTDKTLEINVHREIIRKIQADVYNTAPFSKRKEGWPS